MGFLPVKNHVFLWSFILTKLCKVILFQRKRCFTFWKTLAIPSPCWHEYSSPLSFLVVLTRRRGSVCRGARGASVGRLSQVPRDALIGGCQPYVIKSLSAHGWSNEKWMAWTHWISGELITNQTQMTNVSSYLYFSNTICLFAMNYS